ncbi:hypothetical protein A5320_10740 [Rheinheimera sp. SA_1]|nr:hypothetical protein A5320_10740 [Rheinheimera sp. SA_1]
MYGMAKMPSLVTRVGYSSQIAAADLCTSCKIVVICPNKNAFNELKYHIQRQKKRQAVSPDPDIQSDNFASDGRNYLPSPA